MPISQAQIDQLRALVDALVADDAPVPAPIISNFTATPVADEPPPPPPPPPPPATGLRFVEAIPTNVGAPPGTSCWFGKHTQWAYCKADGKLYCFGGDGDWRLSDVAFVSNPSLVACLRYDFGNGGAMEQVTPTYGNPADGTYPYKHDGCTWFHRSKTDQFYGIPGYQPAYDPAKDPNGIAERGIVHKLDRATGAWIAGPSRAGVWPGEHWGGAYDSLRDRAVIQAAGTGSYGALWWFDCAAETWGKVNLSPNPAIAAISGIIGTDVTTAAWCQRYNPATDELICYDGYRGHVYGIPLAGPTYTPRIIGTLPSIKLTAEPISTVEMGFCISVKRQLAFLSCSHQDKYINGGVGGVWSLDLTTGDKAHADYPDPPGADVSQWTQAEYDDTNECLILAANIVDATRFWGKHFLRYEVI